MDLALVRVVVFLDSRTVVYHDALTGRPQNHIMLQHTVDVKACCPNNIAQLALKGYHL